MNIVTLFKIAKFVGFGAIPYAMEALSDFLDEKIDTHSTKKITKLMEDK